MSSSARTSRYSVMVASEIESKNFRKPIWDEALQTTNGDERAAEKIYFTKRVEQMEQDEAFQKSSDTKRLQRELLNDETAPPRLISKTLLFTLIVFVILALALLAKFTDFWVKSKGH